jgi:hypothetical protein
MTKTTYLIFLTSFLFFSASNVFGGDDEKWVQKCINDNKGEEKPEVVKKYCVCMNNEMDDNETLSITQWEKTPAGKKAEAKCDKVAGWKKK